MKERKTGKMRDVLIWSERENFEYELKALQDLVIIILITVLRIFKFIMVINFTYYMQVQ